MKQSKETEHLKSSEKKLMKNEEEEEGMELQ